MSWRRGVWRGAVFASVLVIVAAALACLAVLVVGSQDWRAIPGVTLVVLGSAVGASGGSGAFAAQHATGVAVSSTALALLALVVSMAWMATRRVGAVWWAAATRVAAGFVATVLVAALLLRETAAVLWGDAEVVTDVDLVALVVRVLLIVVVAGLVRGAAGAAPAPPRDVAALLAGVRAGLVAFAVVALLLSPLAVRGIAGHVEPAARPPWLATAPWLGWNAGAIAVAQAAGVSVTVATGDQVGATPTARRADLRAVPGLPGWTSALLAYGVLLGVVAISAGAAARRQAQEESFVRGGTGLGFALAAVVAVGAGGMRLELFDASGTQGSVLVLVLQGSAAAGLVATLFAGLLGSVVPAVTMRVWRARRLAAAS